MLAKRLRHRKDPAARPKNGGAWTRGERLVERGKA
jgi:hypothetical protein